MKSKILFVGDDAQLPPVKCSDSPALKKQYFLSQFKLDSELFQLDKVLRQTEGSLILENAERIRKSIFAKDISTFNISEDGETVRKVSGFHAVREAPAERDVGHSVIITVTNRDALTYNMAIRKERSAMQKCQSRKAMCCLFVEIPQQIDTSMATVNRTRS
ncbi:MAG: hypothetical protein IPK39_12515 [Sulfuritalea sp.]|nr:hypothetical protein [Sulfuritalea sp.]